MSRSSSLKKRWKDKDKIKLFRKLYPEIKLYVFMEQHLAKVLEFRPKKAA